MSIVAFVGMGKMGQPMAHALQKAGHTVCGFDVSSTSRALATGIGVRCVSDLAEALQGAEFVVSMVPTGKQVREIYAGAGGIFELAPKSALLIDSSTIDVTTSRDVHNIAGQRGFEFVDAPVTGAVPAAESATLTFMVGGNPGAVERARPVLEAMGKVILHVGPGGSGHAMKICNNMMLGMSMVAISEVFALGEKFGLSYQQIFDVVSRGSGSCWVLTNYCPVPGPVPTSPANRAYESNFSMPMMLKDMRLSQEAAGSLNASTPLAASAAALYQLAVDNGLANEDFSAIFKLISGRITGDS
jgi:3-hydroxyisobutyrate dehydrogenase